MNTLLLQPTDTLFFRDGRPMSGSLAGHGAVWPLPTVINAALHAALHRADLEKHLGSKVHGHDQIRLANGQRERLSTDTRKFGSLLTAGPFPVSPTGHWFFPRPADAQEQSTTAITLKPAAIPGASSLPAPLQHPIANTRSPTKDKPEPWWSQVAWDAYLKGAYHKRSTPEGEEDPDFKTDTHFADTEHTIGIGIDASSGTQDGSSIYSAHYLRLREGWRLGTLAQAQDKVNGDPSNTRDLIQSLFPNSGTRTPIIIGGQQRVCSVQRETSAALPLPVGPSITGKLLKWVLLTPVIFPQIGDHHGGWLPSWVDLSGSVQLLDGPGKNYAKRHRVPEGKPIPAKLVAAITGKPIPVTGYALPNSADPERGDGGAKSTHLAVPAGAVYYFEAEGKDDAEKQTNARALAAALNWHGSDTAPTKIRNRRSTLMGEKGFGLGVCGMWTFHDGTRPTSA